MKNQQLVQGRTQVEKARQIARTLGFHCAARYLCKREWSVDAAVFILLGK